MPKGVFVRLQHTDKAARSSISGPSQELRMVFTACCNAVHANAAFGNGAAKMCNGLCSGCGTAERTSDVESHFCCSYGRSLSLSPKLKHQFVPDHKGWMLDRSLCNVPEANAVNSGWCPWLAFLAPGSQTLTFLLKQSSVLVILQSFGHLQP